MIDEIIQNAKENKYDKDAYIKRKKEQKEKAYKIIDEAFDDLRKSPEALKGYFDIQSKFDMYTPRNALLIYKQFPNAIQLKTRNDWKELNATFKNKNPQMITILEPGESYQSNGRTFTPYNAKNMIDISETTNQIMIKTYDIKFILQALLHECPVNIKVVDNLYNDRLCECNTDDQVLYLAKRETIDNEYLKAVASELAKMYLYESTNELDYVKSECIGYMFCKKYGFETNLKCLEKLCSKYSNLENQEIANDLSSMKEIIQDMNSRVNQYLDEKTKKINDKEQER